ncbi:MAG TPA: hypothetical protein VEK07_03065 [Polyangiaceae bacterium]|nr:hypothetical protein [Polyangiaceae bacterium]
MKRPLVSIVACVTAVGSLARCAARPLDAVVWDGVADGDASTPIEAGGGPATMVWPNPVSQANSDPWIAAHHAQLAQMQPRVLLLDFANEFMDESGVLVPPGYDLQQTVQPLLQEHIDAFMVASQYWGYKNPSAPAFLQYQIVKIVDLRDGSGAVNSGSLPVANGSVDYAQLNTSAFADLIGIEDPNNPGTNLDLCGLFEEGVINEVWGMDADPLSASDPPTIKFADVVETKQAYDANDVPIPGQLTCVSSPCVNQALPCNVSIRLYDFNPGRGAGCQLFDNGLVWQSYLTAGVLPAFASVARTFFNFDFDSRFHAPFSNFGNVCMPTLPDGGACIEWRSEIHAVSGPASTTPFDFSPMSAGCGNVVFPPNATGPSTQAGDTTVLSSCENYGLHNGDNDADLTTPYSNALAASYYMGNANVATDCGGSQPTYLLASMPGLGTAATATDGTPMKNWWVYLFY